MFRSPLQNAITPAGTKRSLGNHPPRGNDGNTDRRIRIRLAYPPREVFDVATSVCRRSAAFLFANRGIPAGSISETSAGLGQSTRGAPGRADTLGIEPGDSAAALSEVIRGCPAHRASAASRSRATPRLPQFE